MVSQFRRSELICLLDRALSDLRLGLIFLRMMCMVLLALFEVMKFYHFNNSLLRQSEVPWLHLQAIVVTGK